MSESAWRYHNPVNVVVGPIDTLPTHLPGKHALLVTTKGFVRRGLVDKIKAWVSPCRVTVWDGVKPNPDMKDLDRAGFELRNGSIDCVIGLGGGSAIDAAKALATLLNIDGKVSLTSHFRDQVPINWSLRLPLIAIPTTSGTGAEVTPFATVWDHENHKKYSLTGDFVYPDLAMMDPSLTMTLGKDETLFPALDAVSHALESLWNKNQNPITRSFALQALSLSASSLPDVINNQMSLQSRQNLMMASLLAGLAISQTRTAIAHSISYPLTSRFGVPHGLACSFTLPVLLDLNWDILNQDGEHLPLFSKLKTILSSLQMQSIIKGYASEDTIIALKNEMITKSRSENYLGQSIESVEQLLHKALT